MSRSIRAAGLTYGCPDGLRSRIATIIRPDAIPRSPAAHVPHSWLAIAASIVLFVTAGWLVQSFIDRASSRHAIAQEVVTSHVRSLLADHLMDVRSSDRHQVKPWFAGKLDFAPSVVDLAPQGFSLAGGRLDYLQHRTVAAIVYHRRQHVINLFIWPLDQLDDGLHSETQSGYQLVHWNQAGTAYWAISDLNISELNEFAGLIRSASTHQGDGMP